MNKVLVFVLGAVALLTTAKGPCPMRGGVIKISRHHVNSIDHQNEGVVIYGSDSLVMSASSGTVDEVFIVGDVRAIMIRTNDLFYTYSDLDTCFLFKGQAVKRGQVMGYSSRHEVEFVVSHTKGKFEQSEKLVKCKCEIDEGSSSNQ